jgi:drug/metabolite transporter (DMT)-like permease
MDRQSSAVRLWKLVALAGVFLIALGTAAFYVDVAAHFRFDCIERNYDAFGMSILVGIGVAFVGFIGWARLCDRQGRGVMAALVFAAPFAALLLGSPIGGTNIHGPSAISMMLTIPATILAVILLIMGRFSSRKVR